MGKLIKIAILLSIIAASAASIFIAVGSRGSDDNYFNTRYRHMVTRHGFLRSLFGLHYDGDARSEYLGPNKTKITIRIGVQSRANIPHSVWQEFTAKLESAVGKKATYEIVDTELLTSRPIEETFSNLAPYVEESSTAYLYIAVLDSDPENADVLGSTYRENGIVLYNAALEEFTQFTPATYNTYAMSTLLHEFGHQIGLAHNNENACLMTEHAESDHVAKTHPSLTVTDFCDFELEQIKNIQY